MSRTRKILLAVIATGILAGYQLVSASPASASPECLAYAYCTSTHCHATVQNVNCYGSYTGVDGCSSC